MNNMMREISTLFVSSGSGFRVSEEMPLIFERQKVTEIQTLL